MIDYRVELDDLHGHQFRVIVTVARPVSGQVVSLPVWINGSYMVRDFARHLSGLEATRAAARWPCRPWTNPAGNWPARAVGP